MRHALIVPLACAVLSIGVSVPRAQTAAPAVGTADGIIAGRQAAYDNFASNFGDMKRAIDAKADPKPYKENALALAKWGAAIPGMFPAGTDKGHDTKARPEIWSDRAGFEKAASNFTEQATKLASVAETGDAAAFATQWQTTGAACGACHRGYRAR